MRKYCFFVFALAIIFSLALWTELWAQQVTTQQLAKALQECERDLKASNLQVSTLKKALDSTSELIQKRQLFADSLILNMKQQIAVQGEISRRLQMNADTLQIMVNDYDQKLDEVAELYKKELQRQSRSWFFTGSGWQGFSTGILAGLLVGLAYGVTR